MKCETTNSEDTTKGSQLSQSQLSDIKLAEVRLTSLTPPIDTPSAIDENQPSPPPPPPTKTATTSISTTTTTENERLAANGHDEPYHQHRGSSRSWARFEELDKQDQDHLGSIIGAIKEGNFERFSKLLCESKDSIENLLNVFVDGQTILHYSLIYGRGLEWCRQLIMNGANPNQTNRAGWHPIHLAAYRGSTESMLYLIDCFTD